MAVALAAFIGSAGHAVGEPPAAAAVVAQAGPAPSGYDPLARQASPKSSTEGEDDVALNPEFENLPDTPGVEDTYYLCTACHSAAIIKQQRLSPARWDYLWAWMIEQQGMPEQDPETKELILSYLKRHFGWQQ